MKKTGLFLLVGFAIAGVILTGMLIYAVDLRKKPSVGSVLHLRELVGGAVRI